MQQIKIITKTQSVPDVSNHGFEIPKVTTCFNSKESKTIINDGIVNKITSEIGNGMHYKRIIHQKLTREVRVAQSYVSLSANNEVIVENARKSVKKNVPTIKKSWVGGDCNNDLAAKESRIKKLNSGFVKRLIEFYNAKDKVKQ